MVFCPLLADLRPPSGDNIGKKFLVNGSDFVLYGQFTLLKALQAKNIDHRFSAHLENHFIQISMFKGQLFQPFHELGLFLVRIVLVPAAHFIYPMTNLVSMACFAIPAKIPIMLIRAVQTDLEPVLTEFSHHHLFW